MFKRLCAVLALTCLLAVAGCDSSTTGPSAKGSGIVAGTVVAMSSGQPLPDAVVMVVSDDFAVVRTARVPSDGAFVLEGLPAGSFLLYATLKKYSMPAAWVARINLESGETLTRVIPMVDHYSELDYEIRGQVTDAVTGAPVAGAMLAYIGLGEGGNTLRYLMQNKSTSIALSDAEGYYSLAAYGVPEYFGGPVIGLGPISCGRQGYRSRTFAGEGPNSAYEDYLPGGLLPAPADSTLELDIVLKPIPAGGLPAGDTGAVTGTVTYDGQPRGGVMVSMVLMALAERDTVFDPAAKVTVHGGSVLTDPDGAYEFTLEPGFYSPRAGLLPDDGWIGWGGPLVVEVVAGGTSSEVDFSVVDAIAPMAPAPGAEVSGDSVLLSWTPAVNADGYRVDFSLLGSGSVEKRATGSTTETEYLLSLADLPPGQTYMITWKVFAYRTIEPGHNTTFTWFEVPSSFNVATQEVP